MMEWLQPPWRQLQRRLADGSLPHAILVDGGPGRGKRVLARELAAAALCRSPGPDARACGRCRSCALLSSGAHPDWFPVSPEEGKTVIRIDQIRELIGRVTLTASTAPRRVALVQPADAMNAAAANAFLKTLEEPSPDTLLILVTARPHLLPATVRSRCQRYTVPTPTPDQALTWLLENSEGLSPEDARAALDTDPGGPVAVLERLEAGEGNRPREIRDDLAALASGRASPLEIARRWVEGEAPEQRLDWLMRWLIAASRARTGAPRAEEDGLTAHIELASLVRYIDRVQEARRLLGTTVTSDLLLAELLSGWRRLAAQGV